MQYGSSVPLTPFFPITSYAASIFSHKIKYTFVGTMFAFRRVPTADALLMHFIFVIFYVFIIFQSKREELRNYAGHECSSLNTHYNITHI